MTLAMEVTEVAKRFGGVAAVDGVSLAVKEGDVVGLIGPNGSGKTSLLNVVSGSTRRDGGSVTIAGRRLPAGQVDR